MAATGTEKYLLTPKSSMPAATPANSESVVEVLATSRASIANAASRTPKFSRMSEESPLPVTAPMRAQVSCTMMRRTVMIGIIQSVA